MFESLGRFIVRRRKGVLTLFLFGIIAAGGVGSLAFGKLDTGGYSDLGSESAKAATYLTEKFKVQEPVAILVIDSGELDIADPGITSAALEIENNVSKVTGVSKTISYWSSGGAPSLKSNDSKAAFLLFTLISRRMISTLMDQLVQRFKRSLKARKAHSQSMHLVVEL